MLNVLAITIVALGSLNPQPAAKVPNGNGSAQSTNADKRGTQESPLVVETRAVHSNEETAEENKKNLAQEHVNRWNIGLTFVIAICAFLQFCGIVGQIIVYIRQTNIMQGLLQTTRNQDQHLGEQVTLMKSQTSVLESSVAVAKQSATAAENNLELIINERRVHIRIDCDDLDFTRNSLTDGVEYKVSVYGPTSAFVIRTAIIAQITDSRETPSGTISWGMTLPEIIPPGSTPIPQHAWFYKKLTDAERDEIYFGQKFIHLNGFIQYKDVFGRERWSYIKRMWQYTHHSGSLAISFGYWTKSSPEDDT